MTETNDSNVTAVDVFGTKKIYQDAPNGPQWDSRIWNNSKERTVISGSKDPYDTTLCSENRGNTKWTIDGKGNLLFNQPLSSSTSEPRFHLNNPSKYFFRDIEATFYMMKIADSNVAYAGCCLGSRSGPNGHSIPADYCDAHTYYQRIRNDCTVDCEKEAKHNLSLPKGSPMSWPNGKKTFPENIWVGFKYVAHNINKNTGIHFELYRDMTGGLNSGNWELLQSIDDTGGWIPPQTAPKCSYAPDYIPIQGGGVVILRQTSLNVMHFLYTKMTVREIIPTLADPADFEMTLGLHLPVPVEFEPGRCTTEHVEAVTECRTCENGECPIECDESEDTDASEDTDSDETAPPIEQPKNSWCGFL